MRCAVLAMVAIGCGKPPAATPSPAQPAPPPVTAAPPAPTGCARFTDDPPYPQQLFCHYAEAVCACTDHPCLVARGKAYASGLAAWVQRHPDGLSDAARFDDELTDRLRACTRRIVRGEP